MLETFKKPFILVDGSYYLYRAYNALPNLTNKLGEPTGAIYGVLNMLRSLLLNYNPSYFVIVFDVEGQNFRNTLFKNYKLHRQHTPYELVLQIKPLYAILKAMGLFTITISGVEADDVIGTLAYFGEQLGHNVLISTNDKDMAQLVNYKINLISNNKKFIIGPKEILDKYGVLPELMVDFLALMGDDSDNIPGIPGIGKKIAQYLVNNIGTIDMIYSNLEKISNLAFPYSKKVALNLKENKDIAYLSYKLAKIKTDVNLNFNCEKLKIKKPNIRELKKLFNKYEFRKWLKYIKIGSLFNFY